MSVRWTVRRYKDVGNRHSSVCKFWIKSTDLKDAKSEVRHSSSRPPKPHETTRRKISTTRTDKTTSCSDREVHQDRRRCFLPRQWRSEQNRTRTQQSTPQARTNRQQSAGHLLRTSRIVQTRRSDGVGGAVTKLRRDSTEINKLPDVCSNTDQQKHAKDVQETDDPTTTTTGTTEARPATVHINNTQHYVALEGSVPDGCRLCTDRCRCRG